MFKLNSFNVNKKVGVSKGGLTYIGVASILWFGGLSLPPIFLKYYTKGQSHGREGKKEKFQKNLIKNHKFYTLFYLKFFLQFRGPRNFDVLYVNFDWYRFIPFQPFNVVVKPAKFHCFYINQHAFNEKWADFYENYNAFEHFQIINRSANKQFFIIECMLELLYKW